MRETLVGLRTDNKQLVGVITLTVEFKQEDGQWVATCLELGTSTYAETLEAVQAEIAEAVDLHLNEVARLGFEDDFLKEMGVPMWRPRQVEVATRRGTDKTKSEPWLVGSTT
ncbi:MAG: hypothetical protein FJ319_06535 [SAR202 cluster bacterium]|nr:hypothetical protein [SAR202 cluster bacterium]